MTKSRQGIPNMDVVRAALGCRCVRCAHAWMRRTLIGQRPVRCPNCKATNWWLPAGKRGRRPSPKPMTQPKKEKAL